jgi:BMFP domain-containing protein YqiC
MSKLLWKSLLVSPVVLGLTLLFSAGTLRAADSQAATEVAKEVAQQQTAKAEAPAIPSIVSLGNPTAPVEEAAAEQAPVEPTTAVVEVPSQVAVTPTQLPTANPDAEALNSNLVQPAADTTLAQVTPAAPSNTDVLNQINRYSKEGNSTSIDQVTNVTQLRDVSPGDWAYEALRSLVERYGCIAGYPDGTYRGNRALSRYEFAAGLNSCLQQVERLIAASTADFVRREDLETLQRLVQEFQAELTTLGARVDTLEGRVSFLEDNQFSTTTKLSGEAIFAFTDEFGTGFENNTVLQDRVRLTLNTSFTGRDRLVTRLAAGNGDIGNQFQIDQLNLSFVDTQTFNVISPGGNDIVLDWLAYYFNFGSSKVYLAATGGIHSDYAPTLNPYFEDYDGGNGALSTFASESPIYRIGGGSGGAISLGVGPLESILGPSTLSLGYLAGASNAANPFGGSLGANNPREKAGLFDGDYSALAQLNFNLGDRIGIGATYVHGYHNTGTPIFDLGFGDRAVVGTTLANNPSLGTPLALGFTPIVTNSYGVEAAFRLSENISISGFGSYTSAILIGQGNAEIWSYGAGVALADVGKEGNVLGIFGGAQPYLGSTDTPGSDFEVERVPYHIEAFYKYQLTNNISVTPGVIWVINPNQGIGDDDDAIIGTLRTTFTF